jgi:hypothetical protein
VTVLTKKYVNFHVMHEKVIIYEMHNLRKYWYILCELCWNGEHLSIYLGKVMKCISNFLLPYFFITYTPTQYFPPSYFKHVSPVQNVLPFWKQFEVNIKLMINMAVLSPWFTWPTVDTFQCINNMVVWAIYYSLEHVRAVFVVWISFTGNGGEWSASP